MTQPKSGPKTGAAKAARIATTPDALDLTALALIGVVGSPTARRALLRHRNGRIESVTTGDRAAGGTVLEIGADHVTLALKGRPVTLALPG
ncbi:MAG: hypothetical protein JXQ91_01270 [Vannielia sp.]|uniref:hypothetical protein n=1 Tax=Rhodobacterales TaxID=204455 RepID=UPI0020958421|nr:hypothetical protein [Oceanicola sp. 502str15]MCO6382441.1 hypothetical protein [Oceanicola sp. 502str15]